eukprot:3595543-Pyramimonas_sp.AAC.2
MEREKKEEKSPQKPEASADEKMEEKPASEKEDTGTKNTTENDESKDEKERCGRLVGLYGTIKTCELAIDRQVNLPKGFAYIEFETRKDAEKVRGPFRKTVSCYHPVPVGNREVFSPLQESPDRLAKAHMSGGQLDGNTIACAFILVRPGHTSHLSSPSHGTHGA